MICGRQIIMLHCGYSVLKYAVDFADLWLVLLKPLNVSSYYLVYVRLHSARLYFLTEYNYVCRNIFTRNSIFSIEHYGLVFLT
jgi:hypothetical protein